MYPLTIHLIVVAIGAIGVLGHPGAAGAATAVRFWEEALPGTPMPEVIADLVQKGIDHSPLVEHYPVTDSGAVNDGQKNYRCGGRCPAENVMSFFFRKTEVRVGNTMTFSFPRHRVSPFLPRDVADGIPFGDPASVLATFHVAPSSAEATIVRDTLSQCQALPVVPEQKACATSLEGTVESAKHMLGNGVLWAAASALPSTPTTAGLPLQSYVIQAVTTLDGDRHVGCHVMPYPYAVYYCHMTGLPTKAYMVSLRSSSGGGPAVTLAALCHLDTSNWSPAHPAFKTLHTQPGGEPICHFMSYANLLFGEKAVAGNP